MAPKTYGQVMDEACACTTPEEAAAMVECEVERLGADYGTTPDKAREVILANIGYGSGYYDPETADRLLRLFNTAHPIFGRSHPTAEESFNAGVKLGEAQEATE